MKKLIIIEEESNKDTLVKNKVINLIYQDFLLRFLNQF